MLLRWKNNSPYYGVPVVWKEFHTFINFAKVAVSKYNSVTSDVESQKKYECSLYLLCTLQIQYAFHELPQDSWEVSKYIFMLHVSEYGLHDMDNLIHFYTLSYSHTSESLERIGVQ